MEIKYTESGQKELQAFLDRQKALLEARIKEEKYVFGDDVVEIVGRDVKEVSDQVKVIPRAKRNRYSSTKMLLKIYFITGILVALFGIFREKIMFLIETNMVSLVLVVAGGGLSLFAWLMSYVIKQREEQAKKLDDEFNEKR